MMPAAVMAEMMQNTTPEERQKGMEAWKVWMDAHQADLADMGAPLGKNMRVTKGGGVMEPNDVGGYSIIQAESQEAVAKILADNPTFNDMPEAHIDVMELMQM